MGCDLYVNLVFQRANRSIHASLSCVPLLLNKTTPALYLDFAQRDKYFRLHIYIYSIAQNMWYHTHIFVCALEVFRDNNYSTLWFCAIFWTTFKVVDYRLITVWKYANYDLDVFVGFNDVTVVSNDDDNFLSLMIFFLQCYYCYENCCFFLHCIVNKLFILQLFNF